MKLIFNPSKLALALSATFVARSSNNVDANVGVIRAPSVDDEKDTIARLPTIEEVASVVVSGNANSHVDASSNGASFRAAVVDVGVLRRPKLDEKDRRNLLFGSGRGGGPSRRSLQNATAGEEPPNCLKPDTCEPGLCACTAAGGVAYTCAAELNAVCNNVTATDGTGNAENGTLFTIQGCVAKGYADYYYNLYCPFAKCVVDGGTENECFCEFYGTSCEIYDIRKYQVSYSSLYLYCAVCCKLDVEDQLLFVFFIKLYIRLG